MKRSTLKCNRCGSAVSLSNFSRHVSSVSCTNGGKGKSKKEKYPWSEWAIGDGLFRLPCGYVGKKLDCRNKMNGSSVNDTNLRGYNQRRSSGEIETYNKGCVTPQGQREKISRALKDYYKKNGPRPISEETRKRLSVARKSLFDRRPELHPNRILASNKNRMTYPELVAFEWFEKKGVVAHHNKRVGRYYPDFLVGSVIVEIDGVRWHSSPAQLSRDRDRDKVLTDMGYRVYRISSSSRIEDELDKMMDGGLFD